MAYWSTRGLRGSAFEELINLSVKLYQQRGLAVIQKVPTPITPIEVNNASHTITSAYFEKKSTVDYIGVADGTALCFDAKETQYKNLPLKNIHEHQLEFMAAFRKQGGVSFLLVQFHFSGEIFFLPFEALSGFYRDARKGGRKSVPYDAFDPEYRVLNKGGYPVHFLEAVHTYTQRERARP
ncbi:MAG: Holliday junction resolvase RecU [Clostridiales bacterium]|jgi:recombination protein U|nr:Holliday junction resolvase RecU [Clostridiales bacterium]